MLRILFDLTKNSIESMKPLSKLKTGQNRSLGRSIHFATGDKQVCLNSKLACIDWFFVVSIELPTARRAPKTIRSIIFILQSFSFVRILTSRITWH